MSEDEQQQRPELPRCDHPACISRAAFQVWASLTTTLPVSACSDHLARLLPRHSPRLLILRLSMDLDAEAPEVKFWMHPVTYQQAVKEATIIDRLSRIDGTLTIDLEARRLKRKYLTDPEFHAFQSFFQQHAGPTEPEEG